MQITVLSYNLNTIVQPQYMNRPIKYNQFDVQHISNTNICEITSSVVMCLSEAGQVNSSNCPSSYTTGMNSEYDLNFLADQDGVVDDCCTRAFINKISLSENFGYLDCMTPNILFDTFLVSLITELSTVPELSILQNILSIVTSIKHEASTTKDTNIYKTIDINSGTINVQRTVKSSIFQFQSIPLSEDFHFLESYEIECKNVGGIIDVSIKIKTITLELIIEKLEGNTPNIPISIGNVCI